ncbi:MAG TPA: bifunctional phosphoribosylaminoimidazolecarboxamide formyltransferase/IMP cyclohydrolase [Planctomycetaceae bacterium]|nr:bifunctional phosphoribosylaminoimidazolecarboxamide formyltransferase/IMP cyclohydrolase [Planctomycetaceae bacterium]
MADNPARRALVSVSDKSGLVPFVRGLVELGFEVVSTGGTRRALEAAGLAVTDVSSVTGFPEIMDGRVKTLHPRIHGGLLGRPDVPGDAAAMREHGIAPFELVVCNLYPFEETIAGQSDGVELRSAPPLDGVELRPTGEELAEAIEQIDIGGPSMIRAAAKNHACVGVVTRPAQYPPVLDALRAGPLSLALRRELAAAAFETTARYDRAIAGYLAAAITTDAPDDARLSGLRKGFPQRLWLGFAKRSDLRYGENPHQRAALYVEPHVPPASLAAAQTLHGKELSYNNLLDLDAALAIVREFDRPAAVVIKHNNPCGCGVAETLAAAFDKAYAGDPVSAFGSVLGFNRVLDLATAERLCEPDRFIEAIVAPDFDAGALDALTTRPRWKANVRLLRCSSLAGERPAGLDYRGVTGGLLVQDRDEQPDREEDWHVATSRGPTEAELADLRFAWRVVRHVKSNAIVFAKDGSATGVGAGQMSRLDSVWLAARKSGPRSRGAVLASDAFFPFRDGVDEAARAGVTAVIQPGGSRRDDEVISACDEQGLAMILTGRRHFRH